MCCVAVWVWDDRGQVTRPRTLGPFELFLIMNTATTRFGFSSSLQRLHNFWMSYWSIDVRFYLLIYWLCVFKRQLMLRRRRRLRSVAGTDSSSLLFKKWYVWRLLCMYADGAEWWWWHVDGRAYLYEDLNLECFLLSHRHQQSTRGSWTGTANKITGAH